MRFIQDILKNWKEESESNRVVQYQYRSGILTIYTSQPGYFIGKGGKLFDKYEKILKREDPNFKELKIEETAWYWV